MSDEFDSESPNLEDALDALIAAANYCDDQNQAVVPGGTANYSDSDKKGG